jgi:O-antigen/teichoic acid export membrane protein
LRWRWASRGTLAILDQGLIAGSNFLVSVLLARVVDARAYGAYAVVFATFLLVGTAYQALVLEPMSVLGPAHYGHNRREYLGALFWIQTVVLTIGSLLLVCCSVILETVFSQHVVARPMLATSLALPPVMLFWFARRAFYLEGDAAKALMGSSLYCGLLFIAIELARHFHRLTPSSAFVLMGASAAISAAVLFIRLRLAFVRGLNADFCRALAVGHWSYGRWAVANAVVQWVPWNIQYVLLAAMWGVESSAPLRALANFDAPTRQMYGALTLLLLPYASKLAAKTDYRQVLRLAWRIAGLMMVCSGLYWLVATSFHKTLFALLYKGRYGDLSHLLVGLAIASFLSAAAYGPSVALKAMQLPDVAFFPSAIAAVMAIISGALGAWLFGPAGAILSMILTNSVALWLSVVALRRRTSIRQNAAASPVLVTAER